MLLMGCDVVYLSCFLHETQDGSTPLMAATSSGDEDLVRLYLEYHAYPNRQAHVRRRKGVIHWHSMNSLCNILCIERMDCIDGSFED